MNDSLRALAEKTADKLSIGIAEYLLGDEYGMDEVVDIAADIADAIERVARQAVEAEREACAKIADVQARDVWTFTEGMAKQIAEAIRARGGKT